MWALTRGRDGGWRGRAVWTLALLPRALYCSLAYTEAWRSRAAIAASLQRPRPLWPAGLLAAVASLTGRPAASWCCCW